MVMAPLRLVPGHGPEGALIRAVRELILWSLTIRCPQHRQIMLLPLGLLFASLRLRLANCNFCRHKQVPHPLSFPLPQMMFSN